MSVDLAWIGGAIPAGAAIVYFGYNTAGFVAAIVLALVGTVLWIYSPLPDNNGGYMSGDPGRYWGWSKPEKTNKEETDNARQ